MALIVSASTGNFNATATWVGAIVPTIGDEAQASTGHTVTITANTACDLVSNAGTGKFVINSAVTLTANIQHKGTTNVTNCVEYSGTGANAKIIGNITGGTAFRRDGVANKGAGTLQIEGNCVGGSDASAVVNSVGGTVIISGNLTGGLAGSGYAVSNEGVGSILISGNALGAAISAINNAGGGSITINGNVIGGTAAGSAGVRNASTATSVTINGTCTGGTNALASGIINVLTGSVTLNGSAVGGSGTSAGPGVQNSSTGNVFLTRAVGNAFGPSSTGISAAVGVANAGLGIVEIEALEYGTRGQSPTSGTGIRLKKSNTNVAVFNFCDTAGAKTLIDATQNAAMPAASNVRSGVSYASGALTGSCAVPTAGSVALGVPVDATTGTAALTPAAVWEYASRSLTTSSGATAAEIRAEMDANSTKLANLDATVSSRLAPSGTLATVTTLTNAPTVPTASAIASQVRTELGTELARIDAAVSTRLSSADYTAPSAAPTVTAIRQEMDSNSTKLANLDASVSSRLATSGYTAPTSAPSVADIRTELAVELGRLDASVSSRLAGSAYTAPTTPPTAAQIATAVEGSLLNEADGQAVLNAIVGAIGNTNLSEVSLVAAVRADLERNGGKLDSIPTTAAPTASTVAGAVRAELGTELGRIDAAVSTRLSSASYTAPTTPPTAAQNASAVRSELSTELGRVDAAVSTRLASSAYTAPANSDIASIKSKTDLLNTDRLANVATTNIVGTLLAQANS